MEILGGVGAFVGVVVEGPVGQLDGVAERVVALAPHARRLGTLPGGGDPAGTLGGVDVAGTVVGGCPVVAASDDSGGDQAEGDEHFDGPHDAPEKKTVEWSRIRHQTCDVKGMPDVRSSRGR